MHSHRIGWLLCFLPLFAGAVHAVPGEADALQGLHGNTLVAGKTTAFRLYVEPGETATASRITATILRPDGSRVTQTWPKAEIVALQSGSRGDSLVVRVPGTILPWIGNYNATVEVLDGSSRRMRSFVLDKITLLPTKDLIVGVDRVNANDVNPGTDAEIRGLRDAMARLASIWPIRDGISELDGDTSAGLRYVVNNHPQPYGCDGNPKHSDCQLCPFFSSKLNSPAGHDVMNLGIGYRAQDSKEPMGGIAPNFCPNQAVGWASIVMTAPAAPGIAQETGHVFGLEPDNDPHFDRTPGIQRMHSKDNTIATTDSERGFDIGANAAFPSPTFDGMHQAVCGCKDNEVTYNVWDWEFLRTKFTGLASTGPTVPTHFFTDAGPSVASAGNSVYFFARRADGRISYDRAVNGRAGDGWREVDGDGRSDRSPSAAAIGGHVFVAIRGLDGKIQLNQADDGGRFSGWQTLNFSTDFAPSVAAVGQSVFVFATGRDLRVYASQAVLGHPFSGWFELQGGGLTNASPSAAAIGTHVFIGIKGLDGTLQLNQAELGHAYSGWTSLNLRTDKMPGLASVRNRLFVFATATDGRLLLSQAVFGQPFSEWFEVQGGLRTNWPAAGASIDGHVFVAATGTDGRVLINQADLGNAFGKWFP